MVAKSKREGPAVTATADRVKARRQNAAIVCTLT